MNELVKKLLSSALVCALLSSTLAPSAFAEEGEPDLSSPPVLEEPAVTPAPPVSPAPTEDEGESSATPQQDEQSGTQTPSASDTSSQLPTKDADSLPTPPVGEQVVVFSLLSAADEEEEAKEAEEEAPAEDSAEEAVEAVLKVNDTLLGTAEDNSGWGRDNAANYSGWRYDTNSISLVNNSTAVDITAVGQGLSLSVSGMNRIGTLYADGDVNITGTGILLVDNIDMLAGTRLNLLTNTALYADGTGSVALFVRNPEDGKYYLANAQVTGLVDESVSIPEGVDLVIPEGSKLEVHVLDQVLRQEEAHNNDEGFGLDWDSGPSYTFDHMGVTAEDVEKRAFIVPTAPMLTISKNSSLTVATGATLFVDASEDPNADSYHNDKIFSPAKVTVEGVLQLLGQVIGERKNELVPEVVVEASGSITGDGTLQDIDVVYSSQNCTDTIHTAGSTRVVVRNQGLSIDAQSGDLTVIMENGSNLKELKASETVEHVDLLPPGLNTSVFIQNLSGSALNLLRAPVHSVITGEALADLTLEEAKQQTEAGTFVLTTELIQCDSYFYPISKFDYSTFTSQTLASSVCDALSGELNYSTLSSLLTPSASAEQIYRKTRVYRVVLYDGQQLSCVYLQSRSSLTVNGAQVVSIGILLENSNNHTLPEGGVLGDSAVTTGGNTGAGTLGGSGAGSLQGGSPTGILSGSRTNTPAPPADSGSSSGSADSGNSGSSSGTTDSGNSGSSSGNTDSGSSGSSSGTTDSGNSGSSSGNTDSGNTDPSEDPQQPADPSQPTDPAQPEDPASPAEAEAAPAQAPASLRYSVSGTGTSLVLQASRDGKPLQSLQGSVLRVSLPYSLPANADAASLFVVFLQADGTPVVFRGAYDAAGGILSFSTTELGEFTVVSLVWSGTDLTAPDFLAAIQEALANR